MPEKRLDVRIVGHDELSAPFKQGDAAIKNLGSSLFSVRNIFAGFMGLKAVSWFKDLTISQLGAIDSLAKFGDELGLGVEKLAAYRFAAQLTGVGTETLDKALQTLNRRLGEASRGGGEGAEALRLLGLDAKALIGVGLDEALKQVSEKIRVLPTQAEKSAMAFKLLGRTGSDFLNFLEQGRSGLDAVEKEAQQLGMTFTRDGARAVEQMNDSMTRLKGVAGGLAAQFAVKLAPSVVKVSDSIITYGLPAIKNFGLGVELAQAEIKVGLFEVRDVFRHTFEDEIPAAVKGLPATIEQMMADSVKAIEGGVPRIEAALKSAFITAASDMGGKVRDAIDAAFAAIPIPAPAPAGAAAKPRPPYDPTGGGRPRRGLLEGLRADRKNIERQFGPGVAKAWGGAMATGVGAGAAAMGGMGGLPLALLWGEGGLQALGIDVFGGMGLEAEVAGRTGLLGAQAGVMRGMKAGRVGGWLGLLGGAALGGAAGFFGARAVRNQVAGPQALALPGWQGAVQAGIGASALAGLKPDQWGADTRRAIRERDLLRAQWLQLFQRPAVVPGADAAAGGGGIARPDYIPSAYGAPQAIRGLYGAPAGGGGFRLDKDAMDELRRIREAIEGKGKDQGVIIRWRKGAA